MLLDEPGDPLAIGRRQAEARAKAARDLGAGVRMILGAPLGDVVQEGGDIERRAIGDVGQDLADQRMVLREGAGFDLAEHADGAQQVLVDGVMMVHRELHHADDAAEVGNEAAEHAGFVHAPQRDFGRAARGQDFQEQPVGFRIGAQLGVDALERLRDEPRRLGVDRQARAVGGPVETDEVYRIALERVGADHVDAVVLDLEIDRVGDGARPAAQSARGNDRAPGVGLACRSSSAAQTIAVRSPTSLATRK